MKPSVTAPGSLAMASAVALSLMPSPLTMMAMRGASGFPGSAFAGWAKASAGRMLSAAILGMAPWGDISRNFWSSEPASGAGAASLAGAGMATSLRSPVLPSMMVMVLVAPGGAVVGPGVGRAAAAASGLTAMTFGGAWPSAVLAVGSGCRLIGTTTIGSPPNGLFLNTAPTTNMPRNSVSTAAMTCDVVIGIDSRRLRRCWPSGAFRSSAVIIRSQGPIAGESCAGVYHGRSRAGLGRDYWLSGGSGTYCQECRQTKKIRGGSSPPRIQPDELDR